MSRVIKVEGTCGHCKTRITGNLNHGTWRHEQAPADKHQAQPSGEIREI